MTQIDYAARVRRGAKFLDDLRPGWAGEINLVHLSLEDSCQCVLGQLYGHYITGIAVLVKAGFPFLMAEINANQLGFNVPASERFDWRDPSPYRELDELWIAEIHARLMPAPPVELPALSMALELQPA